MIEGMLDSQMGLCSIQFVVDELEMLDKATWMGEGAVDGEVNVGLHFDSRYELTVIYLQIR